MKSLKDFNFTDKRVLVRCDFNVSIKDGVVSDDFRIKEALPTINYLIEKGAKIILLSHLAKAQEKEEPTLKPVAERLKELLPRKVNFIKECRGKKVKKKVEKMKAKEVVLLENLRSEKGEESNDEQFAKELAELGDVYVSEAFSVSHRAHASIEKLPKLLPSFAGFLLNKEIEALSRVRDNPARPLVVVLGGAKVSSKVKALVNLLKRADHLLVGGKVANDLLIVKGISIGRPWPKEEVVKIIEKIDLTSPKLHLPIDVLVSPDETGELYTRETGPGAVRKDEEILDIGKETIQTFKEIIKGAKTIVWAGPLGLYENKHFRAGTQEIAEAIVRVHSAFRVTGGGDTIKALTELNLLDKFNFVSTGGGAMLSFLAGEKLPGIEVLKLTEV